MFHFFLFISFLAKLEPSVWIILTTSISCFAVTFAFCILFIPKMLLLYRNIQINASDVFSNAAKSIHPLNVLSSSESEAMMVKKQSKSPFIPSVKTICSPNIYSPKVDRSQGSGGSVSVHLNSNKSIGVGTGKRARFMAMKGLRRTSCTDMRGEERGSVDTMDVSRSNKTRDPLSRPLSLYASASEDTAAVPLDLPYTSVYENEGKRYSLYTNRRVSNKQDNTTSSKVYIPGSVPPEECPLSQLTLKPVAVEKST